MTATTNNIFVGLKNKTKKPTTTTIKKKNPTPKQN